MAADPIPQNPIKSQRSPASDGLDSFTHPEAASDETLVKLALLWALAVGGYAAIGGLIGLVGWAFNIPILADWDTNTIAIQPNTALCSMAAGCAIILLARGYLRPPGWIGAVVLLIGLATGLEYLTGLSLGIDTPLMFGHLFGQSGALSPGRMGPPSTISWTLVGLALAIRSFAPKSRQMTVILGLTVVFIAAVSFCGYLFGADPLFALPRVTTIAWQTSSFLIAVGAGLMLSVTDRQPMRALLERSSAGILARQTLPFLIALPIVLGLVHVYGREMGLYDTAMGTAGLVLIFIVLMCAVLWRGVTAVRAHEAALRARQIGNARLDAIVESSVDAIYTYDLDGIIRTWNQAAERLYGYHPDEVVGKHARMIVPDDISDEIGRLIGSIRAGEPIVNLETFRVTKSGRRIHAQLTVSPVVDPNGVPFALSIIARDVTSQKEVQERLRYSEERFRLASDAASALVYDVDLTGKRPVIVHGLERVTGYTTGESDMSHVWWHSLIHPDDVGRHRDLHNSHLESGGNYSSVYRVTRKDGETIWVVDTAQVIKNEIGDAAQIIGTIVDITNRKSVEIELRESSEREKALRMEAESANRAKDEFLAVLSHELRTPLNSMYGWTQILLGDNVDAQTTRKGLETISRNVRHQSALIEDLLDVSRIISGKMSIEKQNVSLIAVVRSTLETLRPLLENRDIHLEQDLEESSDVLGDRNRLQQIVGNLFANAIKFTPPGGRIAITLTREKGIAKLNVRDSGIGIDSETLPNIFQPFWQADGSYKRRHGGLGLGLTIAKNLVELHGGTIAVRSDGPAQGSTFSITLPLANADTIDDSSAPNKRDASPDGMLAGINILVVDDDADTLDLMKFAIENQGASVTPCSNAGEAFSQLASSRYDLLISDLGMAGIDGFDLINRIRAAGAAAQGDIPAIALSGYVSANDRALAVSNGFQIYLPKPVDFQKLTLAIQELTSNKSANSVTR
jgi:PAS domain S-box-containing protein